MGFSELTVETEYRSPSVNIVKDFYIPILNKSKLYKRAVGFFSSTALIEISQGITGLMKNGGKIMLIASPRLSEEDVEAIEKGYSDRNKVIEQALINSFNDHEDYFEVERLNLLANLIAEDKLDIKIAFTETGNKIGIYHEKLGVFYDDEDNLVAFTGSMNETGMAMAYNYETVDVYRSWANEYELDRALAKESAFNALWNDYEPTVVTLDFPLVIKEKLMTYKKSDIVTDLDEQQYMKPAAFTVSKYGEHFCETEQQYIKSADKFQKTQNIGPYIPQGVKLHEYQKDAIDEWESKGFRGIFDMATGTGKTYTGLGALTKLSAVNDGGLAVIIVCPYQHLVEQWVEDILAFNIKPIIGYSSSSQRDWKKRLQNAILDQKLGVKSKEFFCFICTNATFTSDYVQSQINRIKSNAFIIVDEAHNFGSERLSSMLTNKFNYRLALSATLERHNDEEGTNKLLNYFGEKCIEYSLDRAIKEKKLTPYKYYPILVSLNEKEYEVYTSLTKEIGKCIIKTKYGKTKLNEKGKKIALKRARLVAAAAEKIEMLRELIRPYLKETHILVYCGAASLLGERDDYTAVEDEDIRQIDAVTKLLGNELNMKVSQFTSKEDIEERELLKKEFKKGDNLQTLIAIKCLDEGVNIPDIRTAFILASTTNPKEYIQRRGRVLRLSEGKDFAEIYDFITTPRPLNEVSSLTIEEIKADLGLVKNELIRLEEFSRIAMNSMEADEVICQIKEAYNLTGDIYEYSYE